MSSRNQSSRHTNGMAAKPEIVHSNQQEWRPYEAGQPSEDAVSVIAQGYELTVSRELDDDAKPTGRWSWIARATSQVSETPEVIDLGYAKSLSGGQRAACNVVNRTLRSKAKAATKPPTKRTPKKPTDAS